MKRKASGKRVLIVTLVCEFDMDLDALATVGEIGAKIREYGTLISTDITTREEVKPT